MSEKKTTFFEKYIALIVKTYLRNAFANYFAFIKKKKTKKEHYNEPHTVLGINVRGYL